MAGLLSRVSEQGIGDMSAMAGPSEDGASQGGGRLAGPGSGGGGTPRVLCTTCGKTFSSSTSLANHKPLHAGHTTCRLCAKVYATRHNLRVHMRRDHGVEPGGGEPGGMPPHWAGPGSL
ncbi:zinc finger protein 746-like [Pollicipes pollicipes]|uniref:zinc finger protein 746-like n=1 Tax=Pollicipes pollicipes TaxID=41117 RepID=UPI001884A37F|nr:zinc finger protein 746-like [Pollicipes pollicipes]